MRLLTFLCLSVLWVAGCGSGRLPGVGDTHPASPAAAEAPVPRPSAVLDVGGRAPANPPPTKAGDGPHAHHGMEATPPPAAPATPYTCPMHPEVVSKTPGACPKCGMALVPKKPAEGKK